MSVNKRNLIRLLKTVWLTAVTFCGCYYSAKQAKEEIVFYHRDMGSINSYYTYFDNFKITNYTNKSVLASDLFAFAKKYVDTVHADKPVSYIIFIGEPVNFHLPKPTDDYFNRKKKYSLIGFGFDNSFPSNANSKTRELSDVRIWKDGVSKMYEYHVPSGKKVIDSILDSKEPFDNNF